MWTTQFFMLFAIQHQTHALWSKEEISCPLMCTCRVEIFAETAIQRFIKSDVLERNRVVADHNTKIFNEADDYNVFTDDQLDMMHTATCVLQTETEITVLLDQLPITLESLILIQGTDAGNKSLRTGDLGRFERLRILELRGNQLNGSAQARRDLSCIVDAPLPALRYANFDWTRLVNGRSPGGGGMRVVDEDDTFQYTQPLDNGKTLTFIQPKVDAQQPILPYAKYKSKAGHAQITLAGFDHLRLLRITHAQLNTINYEMFAGLGALEHLLLEDNDLRMVPEFAFYGTPHLKSLSLAGNNLLTIRIADLAGLMHLEYLDLARNNFTELSELSLPPFPQLKLVNFADNPIGLIYPNTFEVLNTTRSVIVGGVDIPLKLMSNAFVGLVGLQKLTVLNLRMETLGRDVFVGMPALIELRLSDGYITRIEYDTFLDCVQLERLVLSGCHIYNVSVDAFLGLTSLRHLDLSGNYLEAISGAAFDGLDAVREIYLNDNRMRVLPGDLFAHISPKLVRLEGNPWHCSCAMTEWRPAVTNRVKMPTDKCGKQGGKKAGGQEDLNETIDEECKPSQYRYKYVYDNKVAPKCAEPRRYANISVFHAMRKMHCQNYRPAAMAARGAKITARWPQHQRNKMRIKQQMAAARQVSEGNDLSAMPMQGEIDRSHKLATIVDEK